MKRNFLKVLTVSVLAGGMALTSTQAFAKNIEDIKPIKVVNESIMLAKNNVLQDGKYTVNVEIFKEKSDELSMAGQYVGKKSALKVENGQIYMTIDISRIDWMKNIKVLVDGNSVSYKDASSGKKGSLTFKIPSLKSSIALQMNVVPMANAKVGFRVVPQGQAIKISDGSTKQKSNVKSSNKENVNKVTKNVQTNKDNIKVDKAKETNDVDNNNQIQSKEKEIQRLPQTGLPIGQVGFLAMGQMATVAGLVLLKKKNN